MHRRSQGFGDDRESSTAETGVGTTAADETDVPAERGVVRSVKTLFGVKGVRVRGEKSVRPERGSPLLPVRR
jgi:hypothetical protein